MRLSKLLVAVTISLLFSSLVVNITNAENSMENIVEATIDIEFSTGTDFKININMDVSKLTLAASDTAYTKNEIKTIAGTNPEIMGAIKYALKALLTEQIKQTFEDADVTTNKELPTYENGIFYDKYAVNLTSSFFNVNETVNIPDFVNGVLDIGALVNYTFNLKAESGWNNTYTIILPDPMEYQRTTGSVSGNRIQWYVGNGDGEHPDLSAEISFKLDSPTTSGLETENIELDFGLNCSSGKQTVLTTNVLVKNVDIEKYNILPDFVTNLKVVPSDGMRLFIKNGLLSWEEFYNKTIKPVKENAILIIENSSFNQTLDVLFNWDPTSATNCTIPYNITNMDNNPPIKAIFTDEDVNLQMFGITSRALLGLVNAGAKTNISVEDINFGDKLEEIGYPYNISLYLPDNFHLDGENIYVWNQSMPISGKFEVDNAAIYSEEKIDTLLEIEVSNTDLNILSFFTGGTKLTLNLFLQEKQNRSVTTLPDNLKLPEKLSLDYLNSDAFRLCIEENVFDENSIDSFLNAEKQLFESRAITIFSGLEIEGRINRNKFDESLKWDGDITNMDDGIPLEIVSYAHCPYSIPFEFSFILPKFEVPNQSFNFTGLQNQNVTYRIIFPQGTTIEINDSLNKAVVSKTEDGRYYLEISFNVSDSGQIDVVSYKIVPSILFIVGLLMPCIVSLIITIILVIVIYLVRKKRKRGRGVIVKDENQAPSNIEEQDYYIPPPPR